MLYLRSSMLSLRMMGLLMLMPLQGDAEVCPSELNPLTLEPPNLVVEYEQPAQANCSTTFSDHVGMYWGDDDVTADNAEFTVWEVANMSDWNAQVQCNIKLNDTFECSKDLLLTVYKNPESIVMYPLSRVNPVVEGTQYQLQCDIINVAPVQNLTVRWYQGNETIKTHHFSNMTKTPVNESSILTISLSKKENGATFRCEAQLDLGPQLPVFSSETHIITVHYEPVVECQNNFTGIEYNFSLSMVPCQADGNPPAHVEWYHQGKLMNASMPLTRMDSGEYDFIAENSLGGANATTAVTVEYAPEFQQAVTTVSVAEGGDVFLDCEAHGNPAPQLQWASDAAGQNKLKNVEKPSNLNITGVTNNTTYYCTASNKLGNTSKQIDIHVITTSTAAATKDLPTPVASEPRETCPLELMPDRVVVRYGDPASVNCSTSSTNHIGMGWEATVGGVGFKDHVTYVTWTVEKLEDWSTKPQCYITLHDDEQCTKSLSVTLYKTPDAVSVSQLGRGPLVEGTENQLRCDIINVAPVQNLTVKWYRGNETMGTGLFNDTRQTPGNVMSSLSIIASSKDNGAKFRCEALLYLGPEGPQPLPAVISEPYVAVVHYKPLIQDCPTHYTGVEHNFTLSMVPCRADGNPAITVQWHHQGRLINASEVLNRTHSGMFTFEAKNTRGRSNTSVDITMEYGPMLICHDRDEVNENAEHQSQCKAEGKPEPLITWLKDEKEVSFPKRLSRRDSGEYSLRATNKHGTVNHTLYVDVLYAPEFQQGSDTVEVTVGGNVFLICSAEGNPPPELQWHYTSAENVKETPGGRQRNVSITGATSTNTGIYICVATNKLGSVTRSTTLIMKDKTVAIISLMVIIPLIIFVLLIVWYYCRRKQGQYNFFPVNTRDDSSIPMTQQS